MKKKAMALLMAVAVAPGQCRQAAEENADRTGDAAGGAKTDENGGGGVYADEAATNTRNLTT